MRCPVCSAKMVERGSLSNWWCTRCGTTVNPSRNINGIPKLTKDGLPADAKDWTEADWQDLYEAMEAVKRKVKVRHAERREADGRTAEPAPDGPSASAAR